MSVGYGLEYFLETPPGTLSDERCCRDDDTVHLALMLPMTSEIAARFAAARRTARC